MTNSTTLTCVRHDERNTESWIIQIGATLDENIKRQLIGTHLNIYDYFGDDAILVFAIENEPKIGKVFKDVYILTPEDIPEENAYFLANGHFIRNCLPVEMKEPDKKAIHSLHVLDAIELVFGDIDARDNISKLQKANNVRLIGVRKFSNIHFSRGYDANKIDTEFQENTEN